LFGVKTINELQIEDSAPSSPVTIHRTVDPVTNCLFFPIHSIGTKFLLQEFSQAPYTMKTPELYQPQSDYSSTPIASPPPSIHTYSDFSGSDGSESDENIDLISDNTAERSRQPKQNQVDSHRDKKRTGDEALAVSGTETSMLSSAATGIFHGVLWMIIAEYLPHILSGRAIGKKIYAKAFNNYDPAVSVFDNTMWTYGTDYTLTVMTGGIAIWILQTSKQTKSDLAKRLSNISSTMLFLYATSTLLGGIAHHNFLTVESRNTMIFRVLWTTCSSTVYIVPTFMGMIGNECLKIFQARPECPPLLKSMPRLSDTHWLFYGVFGMIYAPILGFMSFQRPACDIFIAGVTQTPCTFYCMGFLYLVQHPAMTKGVVVSGLVGFIMNAYLLPLYPFLAENQGWSLGATNALMHANLFIAWGLQGLTLQRLVQGLVDETKPQSIDASKKDQ